ncbi:MAG: hypothetical protein HPY55_15720 [Firmicutes bacterium]|nr:hypothetical protein [Bacillota bacterium]
MYWVTHAAVGAVAGSYITAPLAGLAAGGASHAVLDMIPHHDYKSSAAGIVDFLLGAVVLAATAGDGPAWGRTWAVLGAIVPDFEVALSHFGVIDSEGLVFPTHSGLLPHANAPLPWGGLTQLGVLALAYLLLR